MAAGRYELNEAQWQRIKDTRDGPSVIGAENAFDLSQKPGQEPKVFVGNADEPRDDLRRKGAFGQADANWCPALFQERLHLIRSKRANS